VYLCSAQLTSYCTGDAQCNNWSDYSLKFCNTTTTPGVCASLVPVTQPGASVGTGQYCQGLWKIGNFCMRGIRPGGQRVGDASTDICIHSSYDSANQVCRPRAISQADCSGNDHNCKLGYECIHTTAGYVCQNAGTVGTQCGGHEFGHSGCTNGVCVGHTCEAYVEKGQRCQNLAIDTNAQCPDYLACNLGKCVNALSVSDEGCCTSSLACKSGLCYLGHCFTRKRNACANNAECDTSFCKDGKCWSPFKPIQDMINCLKSNKINMANTDNVLSACSTQYGKYACANFCSMREDSWFDDIPEILALSSVDCTTGVITADSTAVANPSNIFKNCAAVANYEDF